MAVKNIRPGYATKVDAIAANDLADNGTSEATEVANSTELQLGAWVIVKVNDGAGADADGWTLYMRASIDGGTIDSDAMTWIVGWGPSPDSGTIIRLFRIDVLPARYTLGVKNESGAAADFDVDIMPDDLEINT